MRSRTALLIVCIILAGCASAPPSAVPRIWDVRAGRFVSEQVFIERLAAAKIRLLGEIHDNPEHHAARARWIGLLAERGERPVVVLEQFDTENNEVLAAAQSRDTDAERIAEAGRLDRRGWAWPLHRPIVAVALAAGLPLRAGNLSSAEAGRIARNGLDSTRDTSITASLSTSSWPETAEVAQRREIAEGHCNQLPASVIPRMVLAQRARDAVMASALAGAGERGAILIAGNGHVRRDLGVVAYLPMELRLRAISVGLIETDDGRLSTNDPRARDPAFDYLLVTSARDRSDPCAAFRKG
jgi:uncharacterized iron-regulated protein